ncbi:chromate transporter family protein [Burkholderia cepacia]|nr:chromate transporter [Burkholderia cepacia]MDW9225485.1 chromate transporter family protein [Burkholderia cepacia]
MNDTLIAIATIFSQLSLLAFGGGNTILPEMQRQVVDVHHWMSAHEFTAVRAGPGGGPNMMIVSLVGWHVAGWSGLLVASLAKFGPSSIVVLARSLCRRRYVQPMPERTRRAARQQGDPCGLSRR